MPIVVLSLILSQSALSFELSDAPVAQLHTQAPLVLQGPHARPLGPLSQLLGGGTVEVTAGGVVLDRSVTVRATAWGRDSLQALSATPHGACAPTPWAKDCVVGPTWSADGIDAWWVRLDNGVEMGWTIYEPLAGTGELSVDLQLDGSPWVASLGDGAIVQTPAGDWWRVGGVAAWDADDRPLPSRLFVHEQTLRVQVDDAGARYPIVIDPTFTTAARTLTGGDGFGLGIGAGDFNGDNFDDLAISAPNDGVVRVYFGTASGLETTPSLVRDQGAGSDLGRALAVGDITGDGVDDLALSRSNNQVEIILSNATPFGGGVATTTFAAGDFGQYLAITDIDNNGFGDLLVSEFSGQVAICDGTPIGVSCSNSLGGQTFAPRIAAAEDFDGDGFGDLVVGNWSANSVAIVFGSASGLSSSGLTLNGNAGGLFGILLSASGDIDGDGRSDLLIADEVSGEVTLLRNITRSSATSRTIQSTAALFNRGLHIGDADDDGFDDVFLAADDSTVTVIRGGSSGLEATPDFRYIDPLSSNTYGSSMAVVNRPATQLAIGSWSDDRVYIHDGLQDDDDDGSYVDDDCNDSDPSIFPGASEQPGDGVDSNCDATELCYVDSDGDGARSGTTVSTTSIGCTGVGEALASAPLDCDDADSAFAVSCPDLVMRDPLPGTIAVPNTIDIEGAPANARVVLVGGNPGSTTVPCGATLDLTGFVVLDSRRANAAGEVSFTITPPPSLAGRTVVVQAALPTDCAVSNSFTWSL